MLDGLCSLETVGEGLFLPWPPSGDHQHPLAWDGVTTVSASVVTRLPPFALYEISLGLPLMKETCEGI